MGRDDELAELHCLLTDQGDTTITQASSTRAIHGLGGIGKSTLALHYAQKHRHAYKLVWWINAASTEQIIASLATLAMRLCPQWATTAGAQERAAWAILWLQWHPGWLLVFDNVENPNDLGHYLGALPDGHHLATSRIATGWHAIAPTLPLGVLDADTAVSLLCTLAFGNGQPLTPRQRQDAATLAAELGYLPLALEQAGAYLFETGTSLADYRGLLGQVMDKATGGIAPERTIARIWRYTIGAIENRNPLAVKLLNTMVWLAPDNIPRTLLGPFSPDPLAVGEALGVLRAYNMISYSTGRQNISIHRLVRNVLRHQATIDTAGRPVSRKEAERLIRQAAPYEYGHPSQWEQLLPHVLALAESTPHSSPISAELDETYQAAALYLHDQGLDADAIPLLKAILTRCVQALGDTHPNTLMSRNNLATAYRSVGDLQRAIPLHESTLAQYEQVLGDTHPITLGGRNNLATAYVSAGDLRRAIPLYKETLAQYEQILGDAHPETLACQNNLANAYMSVGDLQRAIPLHESTLAQYEHALGDTHPNTLNSRNNLANARRSAGDLRRAIPLYKETLAQYEQILGDAHPDTLSCRESLASAYKEMGDLRQAIPLYKETLAQHEHVLGETHPDTLGCRNNLANAYLRAGNWQHAIPLLEATLAQSEQVLGDADPNTLASRKYLADAYLSVGDPQRAIPLLKTTLAQFEQVLGDADPNTLITRKSLADAYHSVADLRQAIPLHEATLAQCKQVLGNVHPITLATCNGLAAAYLSAGDPQRAIPLFKTALRQGELVRGVAHPDTLASRNNLAAAYLSAGDPQRAIPLYEATLAQCKQVLGSAHPKTLATRRNLAAARTAAESVQRSNSASSASALGFADTASIPKIQND
ncbi:tetratricopeptide repeat protein [Streptomyces sp. NBC_01016]|uniref:tetratricopeptide repeat protein n=1 Tax=Streptomyces sp. NBC_01016 TaxID=2903720 RepID=UPI00224E8689|nr:tetratricopeptide repeat protein [Streptomyces sp. NBC_01016]MCX4832496.1 tetratricopeptide repeat protein [Streptomyces sp. NBC_01016]